jgi:hypothetical protein
MNNKIKQQLESFAAATDNEIYDADYDGGTWMVRAVETQETLSDFVESSGYWAEKTTRKDGVIAGIPYIAWGSMQARKGQPRDSLSVLDFGTVRMAVSADVSSI